MGLFGVSIASRRDLPHAGESRTVDDPDVDERLEVIAQRLRDWTAVDEDTGLHVLLEGVAGQVRTRDEGARAIDHRDLRVDLAVDEGLGLVLPCEELCRGDA